MRLVIDGQRLEPRRTGVGRCLENLLDVWSESCWPLEETRLVVRDPEAARRFGKRPGLSTLLVGQGWPGLVWETAGLGRTLRPDDLLLAPANLSPLNWSGRTVLVVYDTLPWSVPESFPWHVRWRFGWRYKLAARRATHVIVPSEATARDVGRVHGVGPDRLSVIYPGPDPSFQPTEPGAERVRSARESLGLADAPFFLFVGKRSGRRNVPAILEAFRGRRSADPTSLLVFVGPGGGDPLPGRESGVVDGGHVAEPVLRGLLGGAVALLYPSDLEGFGLPVVEAQATGCPVVTLRNSALVESAGDAAYYLDAPTPAAIASAMERLSGDPGFRARLIARGLANVRRFDRGAFAEGVKGVIRRVAGLDQAPGRSGG